MRRKLLATLFVGLTMLCASVAALGQQDSVLFVRNDGLGAIGYIDRQGGFVQTQVLGLSSNWTHTISTLR